MSNMFELPLFPLNTVLFPGMPLNLHIFEQRYKRMIRQCLEANQPFGVVLIRTGKEALGPLAEPHEVGCTARIVNAEYLEEGRMNIMALGENRFRILSLSFDQPFLVGKVELYPLEDSNDGMLTRTMLELRPWVKRYMQILTETSDVTLNPQHLPDDPLVLAYLAAVLLQLPPHQKQDLLASARAVDLLTDMNAIYRREVALLNAIASGGRPENSRNFSVN